MKLEMKLSENGAVLATTNCASCASPVTVFEFDVPPAVKKGLAFIGFNFTDAIGAAETDEIDAAIICGSCNRVFESGEMAGPHGIG